MKEKNENVRTSYSENGKDYSVNVRKISNGWLVCTDISWYEGEGEKKQWKNECTETYYATNPLEEKDDKKEKKTIDALAEVFEKMNGLKSLV